MANEPRIIDLVRCFRCSNEFVQVEEGVCYKCYAKVEVETSLIKIDQAIETIEKAKVESMEPYKTIIDKLSTRLDRLI